MKCNIIVLSLLCINFCACDKDENNNSNNFATGIVELPALRNGANDVFVTHCTTFNGQKVTSFSMEYDKSKKHSRWVAFRFDNQTRLQGATRGDNFIPDPSLDMEYQRTQTDFGRKGYDRGHLCASADRLYKQDANDQTFYYTNMSPQRNNFNTGVWLALEGQVQSWALIWGVVKMLADLVLLCCLKKEIHSKRSLFGWSTPILRNRQNLLTMHYQ